MVLQYNLITTITENLGIGKDNELPFDLPTIVEYCETFCAQTKDKTKKNLMIFGRKTWDSLKDDEKPLFGLINFVLTSRDDLDVSKYPDVYVFHSWKDMNDKLINPEFKKKYETIWIGGGTELYDYAQKSEHFFRAYIMRLKKFYESDVFFPKLVDNVRRIDDERLPKGIQFHDGVEWEFEAWENTNLPKN
ncbi:hypothetical protein WA026_017441 [Henosepilachna vigintioctopunctata]|uniref:dihydrofolate reductase n=1 Tax=Henosepilachna vigintioctopunctata TaxID=420089 RepID=A0AAW1VEC3_9CUCU